MKCTLFPLIRDILEREPPGCEFSTDEIYEKIFRQDRFNLFGLLRVEYPGGIHAYMADMVAEDITAAAALAVYLVDGDKNMLCQEMETALHSFDRQNLKLEIEAVACAVRQDNARHSTARPTWETAAWDACVAAGGEI